MIHVTDRSGDTIVTSIGADGAASVELSACALSAAAPDAAPTAGPRADEAPSYLCAPAFGGATPPSAGIALAPGAVASLCNGCEENAPIASARGADAVFASFVAI